MFKQNFCYVFIVSLLFFSSCTEYANNELATTDETKASTPVESDSSISERVIVKTAEIKLHVDQVALKVKEIQSAVNACNGHVMHYELNSNKVFQKEVECSLDSSFIIHQINPVAFLKIKVPVAKTDSFTKAMLSMNALIDKLLIDEEDVTEEFNEKKELIQYNHVIEPSTKPSLKQQQYDDAKIVSLIKQKADLARMNYRTQYLWFDVYLEGNSYIEKNKIASIENMHEPFYVNVVNALEAGWHGSSLVFIALLNIWPLLIIICTIVVLYKKKVVRLKATMP